MVRTVRLIHVKLPCDDAMTAPPKIIPNKMAIDVPDWNKALPDINSLGFKISGKIAYLIGPKKVECVPIMNNASKSNHK